MSGAGSKGRDPVHEAQRRRASLVLLALLVAVEAESLLEARSRSSHAILRPGTAAMRLDPNTATVDELALLPHIGPKLASSIVAYRENSARQPAFRTPADLGLVPRIGPALIEELTVYLHFPPP